MVWETYHSGGEGPPRIDLVIDGVVGDTFTLDNLAAVAMPVAAGINCQARLQEERFRQDAELRKRIDGVKQPVKGGFYYETKLNFPLLDKNSAGMVVGIINHCATAGNYCAHFYPHMDNTALWFVVYIDGDVKPYEKGDRAYYFAHTADLRVFGLEPFPRIPFTESQILAVYQNGAAYLPADLVNMGVWLNGAAYTTSEKLNELGYVLKYNKIYNFGA